MLLLWKNYLSLGASRYEAFRPILNQALKLALLPTINAMSITGLISIPGMMSGQIIGGAPVADAVKYQIIILFMITSSASLSVLASCYFLFNACFDYMHRLRTDRIYQRGPWGGPVSKKEKKKSSEPNPTTRLLSSSDNRSYSTQ
ncbi:hypothetical protein DSO57_1015999 [Entomophthora muscae]|uniref:Uncharacterized protein n=1 Tax=Entomophthora muscae TaxID=34485 RepID=A0ACC2SU28_9FUNG|nr:hypothetical protein DSO57_1015999 [Entomophthora muscae]